MNNPLNEPEWPKLPPVHHDRYPLGLLVFLVMLPGATQQDRDEAIQVTTDALSKYHKKLGGYGLSVVVPAYWNDGRWDWIVNPNPAPGWTVEEESKRMALVALALRKQQIQMSLGR